MAFHIVASTGRTATTLIAAALDTVPGVAACHEGYRGSDKDAQPLLPLINLENNLAYQKRGEALAVVEAKRSGAVIADALAQAGASVLVDVAYYNPTLAEPILAVHPDTRMVAIIRDCEGFVRSSTQLDGEDLLPVGWPDPAKPLSDRERFIAMGRIRPRRGSAEAADWKSWSAIARNIWLWRETNLLLLDARDAWPDRVSIMEFGLLKRDPDAFWAGLSNHLGLPDNPEISAKLTNRYVNTKGAGYQVGPSDDWTGPERAFLAEAVATVNERWGNGE